MPDETSAELVAFDRVLRPGGTVVVAQGAGEPPTLLEALLRRADRLADVTLVVTIGFSDALAAGGPVRLRGLGGLGTYRRLASEGTLDPIPLHMSELERALRTRALEVDAFLVQLAPEDASGAFNLGVDCGYSRAAIDAARVVIGEANRQMPATCGDTRVDAADVDILVRSDRPVAEVPAAGTDEASRAIGRRAAQLVPDGATVQVGVGSAPEAVLRSLGGHRALGVHSGMINDAVHELIQAGVVTNEQKTRDRGVTVTGSLFGSRALHEHCRENPSVQLRPTRYTHDLEVLGSIDRFVAINSALEVDLTGQVNTEVVGGRCVGAVGGHVDFVRGARRSSGGRALTVLPSRASTGAPRIVARIPSGTVSLARSDTDVVVTEWGVADLRLLSLRERAESLIAIAHPDDRDALAAAAQAPPAPSSTAEPE